MTRTATSRSRPAISACHRRSRMPSRRCRPTTIAPSSAAVQAAGQPGAGLGAGGPATRRSSRWIRPGASASCAVWRQPAAAAAQRLSGAQTADAGAFPWPDRRARAQPDLAGDRVQRPDQPAAGRWRSQSRRWRSSTIPRSIAMWSWSARARAAAWWPASWRRPANRWSCWRRAATTTRPITTSSSWTCSPSCTWTAARRAPKIAR